MMATALKGLFQPTQSHLQNVSATFVRWGSAWRDSTSYREVWPNYKFHRSHKKHYVLPHTIGKQMVNIALSKFLMPLACFHTTGFFFDTFMVAGVVGHYRFVEF